MDKELANSSTIEYYDSHAREYCVLSKAVDMSRLYCEFEKHLIPNGRILDAGCGSGRDSAHFSEKGFDVIAIDLSTEMCKIADLIPGITVINADLTEIQYREEFDGIWACASLLHVQKINMPLVIDKLINSLKHEGVLYASWKYGKLEKYDEYGRLYSEYNKKMLIKLFSGMDEIKILKCWITSDTLKRNDQKWINILIKRL